MQEQTYNYTLNIAVEKIADNITVTTSSGILVIFRTRLFDDLE